MPIIPLTQPLQEESESIDPVSLNSIITLVLIISAIIFVIYIGILILFRFRKKWLPVFLKKKYSQTHSASLNLESSAGLNSSKIRHTMSAYGLASPKNSSHFEIRRFETTKLDHCASTPHDLTLTKSFTDPNFSTTIVDTSSLPPMEMKSELQLKKKRHSIVETLVLNDAMNTSFSANTLSRRESITKNTNPVNVSSNYPSLKRHSITQWLRLDSDNISHTKPPTKLHEYPLPNSIPFETLKTAKSLTSISKTSPSNAEECNNELKTALPSFEPPITSKPSMNATALPQQPDELTNFLRLKLQAILETSLCASIKSLLVNYTNVVGEDAYGASHLGLRRGELVQVQCYSSSVYNISLKNDSIGEKEKSLVWTKEDISDAWLNEVEVMRNLMNGENILQLRSASVFCLNDTLYCFSAYEKGQPLVEVIFNLSVDWFDDDVMFVAHDVMSALQYAHEHDVFGGLTLLDVWLFPYHSHTAPLFMAKLGGHFGSSSAFLKKRKDTSDDHFRQHIYTRYLESDEMSLPHHDLYSFGLLVYESLERMPGFVLYPKEKIMVSLAEKKRPTINLQRSLANACVRFGHTTHSRGLRVKLIELFTRCWSVDASRRPSAKEALKELQNLKASWTK